MSEKITRRDFIKISAMTAVAAVAASCAKPTEAPPVAQPTTAPTKAAAAATNTPAPPASKYKEAPGLAAMVKAGTLPPVEERLPEEPKVVQVNDSIGQYGGTWRMATIGDSDGALLTRTMAYEFLLRWDAMYSEYEANVAKSWEVNAEGTEFTFHMRKGSRWSDGAPMTAEDAEFSFVDILANKELNPKLHSSLIMGGEEAKFAKLDDYSFKYSFAVPYGSFIRDCAGVGTGERTCPWPKHYLKDFHVSYAEKAELDKKIKDAGYETWMELWSSVTRGPIGRIPGVPVKWAWVPTGENLGNQPEWICERNPYYWKVDAEGNQLPYIDKLLYKVHEDKETILLAALAGEIDCQKRHIDRTDAVPLLKEASEKQNFHFFNLVRNKMNHLLITFNYCTPTMELRPLFNNQDFRIALSVGMDREEINQVALAGMAEPWQPSPLRSSPYFNEQMSKRYTEYDPGMANELLDKIIPQKDSEGFRMLPDGSKRLVLIIETPSDFRKEWIDTLQIIQNQWKKIGVDMQIKAEERNLMMQRTINDHDMTVWEGDIGYDGLVMVPDAANVGGYAASYNCWLLWFSTNGEQGEEPPQLAKDMEALGTKLKSVVDEGERAKIIKQLQDMEPLWRIGTCTIPPGFGIVKNNFHNMVEEIADLWLMPTIAGANPEQFWIES